MTYVVEKSPGKEESINFPLFSEGWKLSIEANDIERAAVWILLVYQVTPRLKFSNLMALRGAILNHPVYTPCF